MGRMDYTTGLNTSSAIINSQLVPQTKAQWFYPFAVGPVIQGVPASPPQSPPGYGTGSNANYGMSDMSGKVAAAGQNPWNPFLSPVPWLIGMFIVGYLLMRYVHWGYK